MKVLIVFKKTALSLYRAEHDVNTLPLETQEAFLNAHENHIKSLEKVYSDLEKLNISWDACTKRELHLFDLSKYDMVFAVGGDGTVLDASHAIQNTPLLGINSDVERSVGFLCAANSSTLFSQLKVWLNQSFTSVPLNRLVGDIDGKALPFPILNDLLVCDGNPAAVSKYQIEFNGMVEKHKSSGVWISTAVGSTAAINSAGGHVMPLESNALQFRVRELFKHDIALNEIESGETSEKLKIKSKMQEGRIYLDGSHYSMPFTLGQELTIQTGGAPLNLIVNFEMLTKRKGL